MQHRIVGNSAIHWIISLGSNICRTEPATIINWQQFTKHVETLKPMHAENGLLG